MRSGNRIIARMALVASFEIHFTRFLDHKGKPAAEFPEFARDAKALVPLYRAMVLTRAFDAKAVALQRTGPSSALMLQPSGRRRWALAR